MVCESVTEFVGRGEEKKGVDLGWKKEEERVVLSHKFV